MSQSKVSSLFLNKAIRLGQRVAQMSEAELARRLGCTKQWVSLYRDRLPVKPRNQRKLARAGYSYQDKLAFLSAMRPDAFEVLRDKRKPHECWPWTGCRHPTLGYGFFRGDYAHREAYRRAYGPIPNGMCVCHRCDNPECCNPAHLFVGTHRDNIQDSIRKGRFFRNRKLRHASSGNRAMR